MRNKEALDTSTCEICGLYNPSITHKHHLMPRTSSDSTNQINNLIVLCPNHHSMVHTNQIILEGRFLTTGGYKVFYHKPGEKYIAGPGFILNKDGSYTKEEV